MQLDKVPSAYIQGGARCAVCGKRCYLSRREAKLAIQQIRGRRGGRYRSYKLHNFWHVASWQPQATVTYWRDHDAA